MMTRVEPYRGTFGDPAPRAAARLSPSPPARCRAATACGRSRPGATWRSSAPELMVCAAAVRIGPARQAFWAVWDRVERRLHERTVTGRGAVRLTPGRLTIDEPALELDVTLDEQPGIETVCPSRRRRTAGRASRAGSPPAGGCGSAGGRDARRARDRRRHRGLLRPAHALAVGGRRRRRRPTDARWRGTSSPGSMIRTGTASERSGSMARPTNRPPQPFAADLSSVGELRFAAEAERGAQRAPDPRAQPLPSAVRDGVGHASRRASNWHTGSASWRTTMCGGEAD